uniref:hypothetical protein n=1 Tax=Flavobacterium sp. TaxID=239 RepID=UPI00404A718B
MNLKNIFKNYLIFISLMLLLNFAFGILEQKMVLAIIVGGLFYALAFSYVEQKQNDKKEKN